MTRIVQFVHVSLDGFVAGPNGEMDWIYVDDELFDFGEERIKHTDAAIYGRKTWELMDSYWPTAVQNAKNPTKHTINHSAWYSKVDKYTLSNTIKSDPSKKLTVFRSDEIVSGINEIKKGKGKEVLIFGSPTAGHSLAQLGLIDEYWMFVNPIIIGKGIPLFDGQKEIMKLKLNDVHTFKSGVVYLSHQRV